MEHHQVVTLSILEGLLFCSPCYQSRLRLANFAKSGGVPADLEAPQNLRRPRRLACFLLYSTVYLFSVLNKLPGTSERLASISKIFAEPVHSAGSESQLLALFVGLGSILTWLSLRFRWCWGLLFVGLLLGHLRYLSSNLHVKQWFRLQILNVPLLTPSFVNFH